MRNVLTRLAVAFGVIALVPVTAAAQSDRPVDAFWYCHTQTDQSPVYVTPVWDAKAIPAEIYAEFRKVLAAKYNFTGRVTCPGATKAPAMTLAKAEEARTQNLALWQKSGTEGCALGLDQSSAQDRAPAGRLARLRRDGRREWRQRV